MVLPYKSNITHLNQFEKSKAPSDKPESTSTPTCSRIKNKQAITEYFGYWPEFCDAEIQEVTFDHHRNLSLTLFFVDEAIDKDATIKLTFKNLANVDLSDLLEENIISFMEISEDSIFDVNIESTIGLNGTFMCREIEVFILDT